MVKCISNKKIAAVTILTNALMNVTKFILAVLTHIKTG